MKRKHKRLTFVLVALCLLGSAAALMLTAFEENIVFFFSPTDIVEQDKGTDDRRFRLGGLVEEGSVDRSAGETIAFRVTDISNAVPVQFTGILPDLFREGQGIVAEGRMVEGVFVADEVLAKHDENYMPPEVADALKKSGQWKESAPETKSEY